MRQYASYGRTQRWGGYFSNNVVNKLIIANVAVYLLQFVFQPSFQRIFALTPADVFTKLYIWQPLTYMFLHSMYSIWHLFFNMLITWFFGSALESVWGGQRFLKYYITCGLGGALFFMIFNSNGSVVGASGAVFGLYLAYAMLFPNNYVLLWFVFPVKAKYLVTFLALFQLALGVSGPGSIAYFAHLGGMAAGLLFFRREIMSTRFGLRTRRLWSHYAETKKQEWKKQESEKIDSILDKIAAKGYENLSTTEKRILENYSRKQKEDSE